MMGKRAGKAGGTPHRATLSQNLFLIGFSRNRLTHMEKTGKVHPNGQFWDTPRRGGTAGRGRERTVYIRNPPDGCTVATGAAGASGRGWSGVAAEAGG